MKRQLLIVYHKLMNQKEVFGTGLIAGAVGAMIILLLQYGQKEIPFLLEIITAAGTLAAVIVSLWLAQRGQKPRVTCDISYNIERHSFKVNLLNAGEKSVFIKMLGHWIKDYDTGEINTRFFNNEKFEATKITPGDIVTMLEIDCNLLGNDRGNWYTGEVNFEVIGWGIYKVLLVNNENIWEIDENQFTRIK